MKSLLLVGGGGHCLTVIDSLNLQNYDKIGIVDKLENIGQEIYGIPVVGYDDDLATLRNGYTDAFISLGSIGDWQKRETIAARLKELSFNTPVIVHQKAVVSSSATIKQGVLIGPSSTVNALTILDEMCIINTGSIIEHTCIIGDYAHIAPDAVLCGDVTVGKGSHIGAGSVIKQGISIGDNVIIGIGSVVTCDIPSGVVAYGNPCKVISKR